MRVFSLLLFLFWLILIFVLSHQPGDVSSETSRFLTDFFLTILNFFNIQIDGEVISGFVRKMAHFWLYFVLGLLTLNVIIQYQIENDLKKRIILAFLFCFFYAITDEIHQIFVPGRSAEISDVLIDSFGSSFGIFCFVKFRKICYYQNRREK